MPRDNDFNPYAMHDGETGPNQPRERLASANDFSIGEVLSRSWQILRSRFWVTLMAILVSTILGSILGSIGAGMQPEQGGPKVEPNGAGLLLILVGVLVNLYMHCGLMNFLVNLASGRRAELRDIFRVGDVFPKAILAVVLYSLAFPGVMLAGLVLIGLVGQAAPLLAVLLVPVVFLAVVITGIRFSQFFYLLVDRQIGAVQSLELSWKIMEGRLWQFLTLAIALWIMNVSTVVTLGIGLIITVPLTYLATAVYYLGVTGQPVADPYAVVETGNDAFV